MSKMYNRILELHYLEGLMVLCLGVYHTSNFLKLDVFTQSFSFHKVPVDV